jgi:predicted negative regulator of RcsB-dependent stress response
MDAIDEIESMGEQIVEWAGRNGKVILSVAGVCLVIAAVYGYYETSRNRRESDASEALASARDDYLAAMGAQPGAIAVPELANPAAGAAIRQEYAERFRAVAEEHAGTAGAALAQLERGDLATADGDVAGALEIWRAGIAGQPDGSPLTGILHQRMAQSLEDSESWEAAADAYAAAAALDSYTFRHWAMAEAARCYLMADRLDLARDLATQLEAEAPGLQLPDHLRIQLRALRMANPG